MNKPNPIDDLFKQQLGQSSADVPTDMWDRIAAERGTKRKPKAFWLWSSLGTLLVIAGFFFAQQHHYYFTNFFKAYSYCRLDKNVNHFVKVF